MKCLTTLIFIVASLLISTSASAENLLQVYNHAKAYDPQLKAFEENFRSIKEGINQAKAALKPQVNLSANSTLATSNVSNSPAGNGYTDYNSSSYTLSVNKTLYHKELNSLVGKAKSSVAQAQAELAGRRQELIIRTAESYFNVLLNQENLSFAQAEKKAIGKQYEQVKAQFEAGILAITDVKETQSRYDQAGAAEINSANQLELAKESLRVITGRSYKKLSGISRGIKLVKPTPSNVEAWIKLSNKNNKQIQAAKHGIIVTQKNLEQQRAGRKPTVDLVAKHTGTLTRDYDNGLFDKNQNDNSLTIQLNIPLYTGGAISSKVRDAHHNKRQAQYELELQKQLVAQQVRSAYLTVISDISRSQSLKQALNSSEVALEATQAGFEVGTRTAVDVLLSLRNVFAAKRDFASARYNYLLNMLKLKQAAGTITINDLKKTTAMLGR